MNRIALAATATLALTLSLAACKKDAAPPPDAVATSAETEAATEAPAPQTAEEWIKANYQDAVTSDLGKLQYATAEADLDGDGTPEVLAYLGGPMFCGTGGCNLVVLKRDGDGFRKMGETSVVQLPVGVLATRTRGWRDIGVAVSGGGMAEGIARLRFNGKAYPQNASDEVSAETASVGKTLITDEALKPLD
ncbi:hypothetical protein [Novosphingobium sp. KA1]|uniref:hypothetical protein n=1 Tax=Novosphingobium sp. (strain KA1) TaxID=164608 RepID=UPI001A8C659C|nr:hypothetical protein [Novosphingobium sp. KA1]QSR17597.1 hypothetical protein CA833_10435 [Novosphingobium sp. KA1]